MADVGDYSVESQEKELSFIESNRVRYEGVSAFECEECDDEIPAGRRAAVPGVTLCASCQSAKEVQGARFARVM